MWRFDQFIRQAGHFGKRGDRLDHRHRIARTNDRFGKASLPKMEMLVLKKLRNTTMTDIQQQFRTGRASALFFVLLSGISTAATTIMPLVIQA